jgi:hypothetical protein
MALQWSDYGLTVIRLSPYSDQNMALQAMTLQTGFRVVAEVQIVPSPNRPDRIWGPPSPLPSEYRGFYPRVKFQVPKDDHSRPYTVPTSIMCGAVCPLPPYRFLALCLISIGTTWSLHVFVMYRCSSKWSDNVTMGVACSCKTSVHF